MIRNFLTAIVVSGLFSTPVLASEEASPEPESRTGSRIKVLPPIKVQDAIKRPESNDRSADPAVDRALARALRGRSEGIEAREGHSDQ